MTIQGQEMGQKTQEAVEQALHIARDTEYQYPLHEDTPEYGFAGYADLSTFEFQSSGIDLVDFAAPIDWDLALFAVRPEIDLDSSANFELHLPATLPSNQM